MFILLTIFIDLSSRSQMKNTLECSSDYGKLNP